jgi:ATP/maltotriose-dependent transcriptional regulator MalT
VVSKTQPGFRSVVRTRVLERIAHACAYPVALIVAPAGYGKSVALRQYLDTRSEPYMRFEVRPEHATLPSFIRAFAESLSGVAPHMVASLPEALRGTPTADELAAWFNAQLQEYRGLIAVDDLQYAQAPEVTPFLRAAIDITKSRMRWLIASRSTPHLPIASWITYGDMDIAVDERDLAFTIDEAREASLDTGAHDGELNRIVEMTQGWATALNFALRMRVRTSELSAIGSTTREMVYRYLAEQVYDRLSHSERELLHFSAFLPIIDPVVLIDAGYVNALQDLERLRASAAFLSVDNLHYRCHDLFRDFLKYRVRLLGLEAEASIKHRVADSLLTVGRTHEALSLYVSLRSEDKIIQILTTCGFDLIDKCHQEQVDAAIAVLSPPMRTQNSVLLALRGVRHSEQGRFHRAELALQEAMQRTEDHVLRAEVGLRLATVLNNQERDVTMVLEQLRLDGLAPATQGRILSYLALSYARCGRREESRRALEMAMTIMSSFDSNVSRAQILHRLAVAALELAEPAAFVKNGFAEAYDLALQEGRYFTAAASAGALGVVAMLYEDDLPTYKLYSELFLELAQKSGDRSAILAAISRVLHAEVQLGNLEKAKALINQSRAYATSEHYHQIYINSSVAILLAAEGNFQEAYLSTGGEHAYYDFDRVYTTALKAIYAVGCNLREEAIALVAQNRERFERDTFTYPYGRRRAELARLLCALVEALTGRLTACRRIMRSTPFASGVTIDALRAVVDHVATGEAQRAFSGLEVLKSGDYAQLASIIAALFDAVPQIWNDRAPLTDTERKILMALDAGISPKEIAGESGRSIHTVRTLIQRATEKLGCSGRQQTIAEARRRGLLEGEGAGRPSVPA